MPPLITRGTLEQAYDTKELNRVQRPLAAGGKLVGKSVDGFVTRGSPGVGSGMGVIVIVDETSSPHRLSPGYRQLFPHVPLIDCRSGSIEYSVELGLASSLWLTAKASLLC
jgi:hypothetical protein